MTPDENTGAPVGTYGDSLEAPRSALSALQVEGDILRALGWTRDVSAGTWTPPEYSTLAMRASGSSPTQALFIRIEEAYALCHSDPRFAGIHRFIARHGRVFRTLFQSVAVLESAAHPQGKEFTIRNEIQEADRLNRSLSRRSPWLQPFLRPHQSFNATLTTALRELEAVVRERWGRLAPSPSEDAPPQWEAQLNDIAWHLTEAEALQASRPQYRVLYLWFAPVEEIQRLQLIALKLMAHLVCDQDHRSRSRQRPSAIDPDTQNDPS